MDGEMRQLETTMYLSTRNNWCSCQKTWIRILTLWVTSWGTLGNSLNFSELQFLLNIPISLKREMVKCENKIPGFVTLECWDVVSSGRAAHALKYCLFLTSVPVQRLTHYPKLYTLKNQYDFYLVTFVSKDFLLFTWNISFQKRAEQLVIKPCS